MKATNPTARPTLAGRGPRSRAALPVAAMAVAVLGIAIAWWWPATARPDAGVDQAGWPTLALEDLYGRPAELAPESGRVVLVKVWATWCIACRADMRAVQALSASLDPVCAQVVQVSIDQRVDQAREWLIGAGFSSRGLIDRGGRQLRDRLDVMVVPQTLVIDGRGRIVERLIGSDQRSPGDWQRRLAALPGIHPKCVSRSTT